jgi:hypothetical protein
MSQLRPKRRVGTGRVKGDGQSRKEENRIYKGPEEHKSTVG